MRVIVKLILFLIVASTAQAENWRGLQVAPENRCSPYSKKSQYRYSQSLEDDLKAQMGGVVYGPYSGQTFESDAETDIEHIVATSEAHDSGLCSASDQTRLDFASDLLNLTLAGANLNRYQKAGKDAAEWLPQLNQCWFANRILSVRLKYELTIDKAESKVLESILSECKSTDMIIINPDKDPVGFEVSEVDETLRLYDDNGNGRISCGEARKHGIAPVYAFNPAYNFMSDGDGDGVVCE